MKKIIEYVPIITVCLIYFGFCNLHYYYKEFNIDIYNYVGNTEIIQSFLPSIVIISSSLYIYFYNFVINHPNKKVLIKKTINENGDENSLHPKIYNLFRIKTVNEEGNSTETKKTFDKLFPLFLIIIFLIMQTIIELISIKCFGFKNYELQIFKIFCSIIFLLVIYYASGLLENQEVINKNILLISFFTVIFFGKQIETYRQLDADRIKDGKPIKELVFRYNNKPISTSKEKLYIGQTQSSLFIYDTINKNTIIYKTENIDSLIIKSKK